MAKDYIFGFNPTKVPESFERPDHIPEFIHGPRPNIVPSQDNKVISYYEEIIRLKRAMDALQSELEDIIRSEIPDYDISNANNVLSVNEDGTKMEWKPATSASGVSASVEQTATGATITVTDASGTTTATVENGEQGDDGFSPIANVQQTETGASITVTDKSGTTTATVKNGTKGNPGVTPSITATATVDNTTGTPSVNVTKSGTDEDPSFNFAFTGIKGTDGQSIAGPGVPAGGTAGQVLTKKSGTDYDTEWKDPTGGGASGYVTFGGKSGYTFEPRLEENLYNTFENFSRNINESSSVTYFLNDGSSVEDTINIDGVLNIPASTTMEKILSYFIGGFTVVATDTQITDKILNKSDFTITLSSGNAIKVDTVSVSHMGSNSPDSIDAFLNIGGIVLVGTASGQINASINIGNLNIFGQSSLNIYFLEPKK